MWVLDFTMKEKLKIQEFTFLQLEIGQHQTP